MKKILSLCFLATSIVYAQEIAYSPYLDETSTVKFSVPYTLGTHEGKATNIVGETKIDLKKMKVSSARFRINLDSIRMGKDKLDCHFQETLGLDYATSDFPKKHVCDGKNKLPTSGKNALAYPEIEFVLKNQIPGPTPDSVIVTGEWAIHGQKKETTFPVQISKDPAKPTVVVLDGTTTFKLADFGLTVKSMLGISVKDPITVKIHLALAQK